MLQHAEISRSPVGRVLAQHHREIEEACLAIMSAGFADQPRDLVACWRDVEHQLFDHMMAEEEFLFPAYQRAEPENAQDLRDQHAWLREHAFEIGVAIELHTIRIEQLRQFVNELRAHARNEEASLYSWAERHVPGDQARRIGDWLAAA